MIIVVDRIEQCTKLSIRYNRGAACRNLLLGAFNYGDVVDEKTHAAVMRLGRRFGNRC